MREGIETALKRASGEVIGQNSPLSGVHFIKVKRHNLAFNFYAVS